MVVLTWCIKYTDSSDKKPYNNMQSKGRRNEHLKFELFLVSTPVAMATYKYVCNSCVTDFSLVTIVSDNLALNKQVFNIE